ncbi:AAA family ATPase [Thermotoga sp. Ku-13t]|uniref:AAA family ATPase n=1 Tax=Thermotoga sp. Ku-13t TaxID=1755813 RepID=UPI001F49C944|nr:AAA family ATPase [Thermotoga sp. Ku-13t]
MRCAEKDQKKKNGRTSRRFGLLEHKDKPVEEFSTGMRKKLMICKALIHSPEVLFIDEVLNGLDPPSVREVVDYLSELSKNGLTVIMISHILHALPEDSDVALLKDGRIQMEVKYKDILQ